ncbi:MAG: site-specific DNA-methyltransferase [Rhodanobacter sp.]
MDKLKMHTLDLAAANIERLAELFPACVTESRGDGGTVKRAIDFDLLRQELSDHIVEGPQERYRLDWPGKREALLAANAPIAKTLRPCREESVDFDTTQNLFIEGDNLDALKLLQETYLGKVKVVYIDPPYNTGKDFVYKDRFAADKAAYELETAERNESGGRLVANPETNGRFHSDWLTMMHPRLKLARNVLREDGVILISIGENEIANLRNLCDEVFGGSNFVATMVWEKGRKNDAKLFSVGHEYILVYAKSLGTLRDRKTVWREEKPGAREIWEKYLALRGEHGQSDAAIESDLQAWFSSLPRNDPSKKWSRYKRIDKNGPWRDRDISWPGGGGPTYDVVHPETGQPCKVPESGWRFEQDEMKRQIKLGLIEFRADHSEPPFRKAHIRPVVDLVDLVNGESDEEVADDEDEEEQLAIQVRGSYFYKQSQVSVKYLRELMGAKVFTNPKDHVELARLITYVSNDDPDAIIVDFFAGSGSTMDALFALNQADGGRRRGIIVQLPEALDLQNKDQKAAAKFCQQLGIPLTIAEIAKERIRRAGQKIKSDNAEKPGIDKLDIGFRVLKIDTSNMAEVYYTPDALKQDDLLSMVDNVRPKRSPEDLLFQVLLDWGVDLTLPIVREQVAGREVFFVDANTLAACFVADGSVDESFVKELAKRQPLRAVFRDAGFANDNARINVEQIFKTLSPATEVKTL